MAVYIYEDLLIAVERAEKAAATYLNVAMRQQDYTRAEFNDIKTLKRRIDDHLAIKSQDQKGEDGLSVTQIEVNDRTLNVYYSDGTIQTFEDLFSEKPISITNYTIENDILIEHRSDSVTEPKGIAKGEDAFGLTGMSITETGEIAVTYTNGQTEYIGNVDNFGQDPITGMSIVNGHLLMETADGEVRDLGFVNGEDGEDGIQIIDVIFDKNEANEAFMSVELSNGQVIAMGKVTTTVRLASPEDALKTNLTNGNLSFTLTDGTVSAIGNVDGADADDAVYVTRLTVDKVTGAAVATLSNGSTVNAGTAKLETLNGETTVQSFSITDKRELVVVLDVEGTQVNVNVGQVRGKNGIRVTNVQITGNGDLEVTYDDNGKILSDIIGTVAYDNVVAAYKNPHGHIVIERVNGDPIVSDEPVDGINGKVGAFITSSSFDVENGYDLSLQLSDGSSFDNLGQINPLKSHSITMAGRDLTITLDNGQVLTIGNLKGRDGDTIAVYRLVNNTLRFTYSNGISRNATGSIRTLSGVSALDNKLTFALTDDSTYDIDFTIPSDGEAGKYITSLELVGDDLQITYSDSSIEVIEKIQGTWVTGLRKDGNDLYVTWKDKPEELLATVADFDGIDGVWPTAMSIVDSDLVIAMSDGTEQVIPDMDGRWIASLYADGDNIVAVWSDDETQTPVVIDTFDGLKGEDSIYITGMSIDENRDLIITFSDDTTRNIGKIDGERSKWFNNFYREGDDFYVTYRDEVDPVMVGSIDSFDGDAPRWITEIGIDVDRNLYVVWNDEATPSVVGKVDGRWITSINRDGDSFYVSYSDGQVDSYVGVIDGFDGKNAQTIQSIRYDNDTKELKVTYSTSPTEVAVANIPDFNGIDAVIPVSMTFNQERQFVVELSDGSNLTFNGVDYQDQIENITEVDGALYVESTLGEATTDVVVRKIEDISIDVDENLTITTNYLAQPIQVGNVAGADVEDGVYITSIEVINERLIATLSDGSQMDAGHFETRVGIEEVRLVNTTNMQVELTNGTVFDLGRVKGQAVTIDVVDAYISLQNDLILTLGDRDDPLASIPPINTGQAKGTEGASIVDVSIEQNGTFRVEMSDGRIINGGDIKQDLGFAPYDSFRVYNEGESCTYDGKIYIAAAEKVSESPETSPDWAIVRTATDNAPDAQRPEIISPMNQEHTGQYPILVGGGFRNYYSADNRLVRIFDVTLNSDTFANAIYTSEENQDYHQVDIPLTVGETYRWRCRDVVLETGYTTVNSVEGVFTVIADVIDRPVITYAGDVNAIDNPPLFTGSAYSGIGSHVRSVWQVKSKETNTVIYEEDSSVDLTSFIIPVVVLRADSDYAIRVRYISDNEQSAYSSWFDFHTVDELDNPLIPVVSFYGDDINNTVNRPLFTIDSGISELWNEYMGRHGLMAEWEVYQGETLVWSTTNRIDIETVQVDKSLQSGMVHTIRARFLPDNDIGATDWSQPLAFTPTWSVTPSTLSAVSFDNVTKMLTMNITPFVANNDDYRFTVWQLLNSDGTVRSSEIVDTADDYIFDINQIEDIQSIRLRAGHYGRFTGVTYTQEMSPNDIWIIDKPTVSYVGDINNIKFLDTFYGSSFVSNTDIMTSHEWKVVDSMSQEIYRETVTDINTIEWTNQFDVSERGNDYDVLVRYHGEYGTSEWSDPLNFRIIDDGIIMASGDILVLSTGGVLRNNSEAW